MPLIYQKFTDTGYTLFRLTWTEDTLLGIGMEG